MQAKCFLSFIRASSVATLLAIFFAQCPLALSQTAVPIKDSPTPAEKPLPQFIAISIHPLKEDTTSYGGGFWETVYRGHAYTAQMLVWEATGISDLARIKGMPKWATETKYDIEAKIDGSTGTFRNITKAQQRAMILSILTTRFHFVFHYENVEMPVLDLDVAKGGTKHLTLYIPENSAHPRLECYWPESRPGYFRAEGCSVKDLANKLNLVDDLEVIDHTGLQGRYSFDLHFDNTATSLWANGHRFAATYTENAEWPSVYSALTGQLGLRLTKAKATLPVLVIDSLDPPSEN